MNRAVTGLYKFVVGINNLDLNRLLITKEQHYKIMCDPALYLHCLSRIKLIKADANLCHKYCKCI